MSLRSFTRAATAATQSLSLIGRASWQRQKRPPYHGHGDGAPQRRIDRGGKPPRRGRTMHSVPEAESSVRDDYEISAAAPAGIRRNEYCTEYSRI
jgi:hypothetical protein